MSEQLYRSYNDFSTKAIYDASDKPSHKSEWQGWNNDYNGAKNSTPITDSNLNAMLNMLIYIRNVIGKVDEKDANGETIKGDFASIINGKEIETPDFTSVDTSSIATYIHQVAEAIVGESLDPDNPDMHTTLCALNDYIRSLNSEVEVEKEVTDDFIHPRTFIYSLDQSAGKIEAKAVRPTARDVSMRGLEKYDCNEVFKDSYNVLQALNKLVTIDEDNKTSLEEATKENSDALAALTTKYNTDLAALQKADTDNKAAIEALDNSKANKSTSLAGYGIKDAFTKSEITSKFNDLTVSAPTIDESNPKEFAYTVEQKEGKISVTYKRANARDISIKGLVIHDKLAKLSNVLSALNELATDIAALDIVTAKHTADISDINAQQEVTESKLCTNLAAAQTLALNGANGQIITVLENNKATVYVVSDKQLVPLVTESNSTRTFESKNAMEAALPDLTKGQIVTLVNETVTEAYIVNYNCTKLVKIEGSIDPEISTEVITEENLADILNGEYAGEEPSEETKMMINSILDDTYSEADFSENAVQKNTIDNILGGTFE